MNSSSSPQRLHPWRSHWSQPSLAGKRIVLAGRTSKYEREHIDAIVEPERGVIVDEVTPNVALVIVVAPGPKPDAGTKASGDAQY